MIKAIAKKRIGHQGAAKREHSLLNVKIHARGITMN